MKVYSYSLLGRRASNEDQHINILNLNNDDKKLNPINFFGVFDGHGGKAVSHFVKHNLPQLFINKCNKNIYDDSKKSIKFINHAFNEIQDKLIKEKPICAVRCGSTACIAIHYKDKSNKNKLWIANIGDSRAVKCNKHNIAEQLTQDHKPNNIEEKKRIESLGGKIVFDGFDWRINALSLSRSFGDIDTAPYVTHIPQIFNYKISSYDKFIIFACDGLWDVISNQDVTDFINELISNNFKGNYAKVLAELAFMKGSTDNITTVVYMLI